MSITSIFYTEQCQLVYATSSTPNARGIVKTTLEVNESIIPCSVTPISTSKSREAWGIQSTATHEVSFDLTDDIDASKIYAIRFEGVDYIVENYTIYPKFMILDKSITLAVRK